MRFDDPTRGCMSMHARSLLEPIGQRLITTIDCVISHRIARSLTLFLSSMITGMVVQEHEKDLEIAFYKIIPPSDDPRFAYKIVHVCTIQYTISCARELPVAFLD